MATPKPFLTFLVKKNITYRDIREKGIHLLFPRSTHSNHTKRFCSTISPKQFRFVRLTPEEKQQSLWITLERPDVHNAFNEILIAELTDIFNSIREKKLKSLFSTSLSTQIRSVILTGSGASFSAGADLSWMKSMVNYSEKENEEDSRKLFDMFHSIRLCPLPVIARVNGAALGGGSGLVASCDMAFALRTAKFGFTEVKLGLIPAVISPFVMEKIGLSNCSRFFLTGEKFSSEEAKRIGLIQDYFENEQQMNEFLQNICKEITTSGPCAVSLCKDLLQSVSNMSYNESSTKTYVASQIAKIRISSEGQFGLNAFFNRKKPEWFC